MRICVAAALCLVAPVLSYGQGDPRFPTTPGAANGGGPRRAGRGGGPAKSPKEAAPIDITGNWVSIVTEDWRYRMVTPPKGMFGGVPLNPEGRKVMNAWDPAKDEAAGQQCRSYGAAALMRVPGRFRIAWQDDYTIKIDADAGTQTRLFHFRGKPGAAAGKLEGSDAPASWQGFSVADWELAPDKPSTGNLKVVTTHMLPGYLRKNGVPYSGDAVLTEYYDRITAPNGDEWLVVTTVVEDPQYLTMQFVTSTHYEKESGGNGFSPEACSAK